MLIRDARAQLKRLGYGCMALRDSRTVWSIQATTDQVGDLQAAIEVLCKPNEYSLRRAADWLLRLARAARKEAG